MFYTLESISKFLIAYRKFLDIVNCSVKFLFIIVIKMRKHNANNFVPTFRKDSFSNLQKHDLYTKHRLHENVTKGNSLF